MSHDEDSSSGNPFEDVEQEESSIGGLSTSFGSDDEGSQAEEVSDEGESERDHSPVRAPARRARNDGGGRGRAGGAGGRAGRGGVAATNRTAAPSRARTTTRGAGRGRSRRPVKGASKFCGRCGHQIRDTDAHSHKGCGRTYFYKFSVSH